MSKEVIKDVDVKDVEVKETEPKLTIKQKVKDVVKTNKFKTVAIAGVAAFTGFIAGRATSGKSEDVEDLYEPINGDFEVVEEGDEPDED